MEYAKGAARLLAMIGLTAGGATAAQAGMESANADARILGLLSVSAGDVLSFGSFSEAAGSGIIDMAPNGTTNCVGFQWCGGSPQPGTFDVSGEPNHSVHISMPGNFFLHSGGNSVEIGNVVFSGSGVTVQSYFHSNAVLDASGALEFRITGSLWAQPGTPAGSYSGTYTVTVDYQ